MRFCGNKRCRHDYGQHEPKRYGSRRRGGCRVDGCDCSGYQRFKETDIPPRGMPKSLRSILRMLDRRKVEKMKKWRNRKDRTPRVVLWREL